VPNPMQWRRWCYVAAITIVLSLGGCDRGTTPAAARAPLQDKGRHSFPAAPPVRAGALTAEVREAVSRVAPALREGRFPSAAVQTIAASGDGRMAWYLHDLLRFVTRTTITELFTAFETLSGAALPPESFTAIACCPVNSITSSPRVKVNGNGRPVRCEK